MNLRKAHWAILVLLLVGCGRQGLSDSQREDYAKTLNIAREFRNTVATETDQMRSEILGSHRDMLRAKSLNYGAATDAKAEQMLNDLVAAWNESAKDVDTLLAELDKAMLDLQTSVELDAPIAASDAKQRILKALENKITFVPPKAPD